MIKSSNHTTKFANPGKLELLNQFNPEYRNSVEFYVDYLWDNLDHTTLRTPKFISTKNLYPNDTRLSKRALTSAATQACGIVSGVVKKQSQRIYQLNKLQQENKPTEHLQNKINNTTFSKPVVPTELPAELNSITCEFTETPDLVDFDGILTLKSIGKYYGKIIIPIKYHKHSNQLKKQGKLKTSFLVSNTKIGLRWEYQEPELKTTGSIIGADQGVTTCVTMSDGQVTKKNNHNHDLASINHILSRKQKGSRAFARAQAHRTNYINWSINQLNLDGVREFRLEKLFQMRTGQKSSRYLSHFTYTQIRDKIRDVCSGNGVHFFEQDNKYRSQRCHECGFVHQKNRKGKIFKCRNCGHEIDADLNAASNHAINLGFIPSSFWSLKLNHTEGFYWHESGLFDSNGREFSVLDESTHKM